MSDPLWYLLKLLVCGISDLVDAVFNRVFCVALYLLGIALDLLCCLNRVYRLDGTERLNLPGGLKLGSAVHILLATYPRPR